MTPWMLASLFFAALTAVSAAGLYVAWPRPMSPEEWIERRHVAEVGAGSISGRGGPNVIVTAALAFWPVMRLRWTVHLIRADLDLLKLHGARAPANEDAMTSELLRLALLGAGAGLVVGIGLWTLAGHHGLPTSTALFTVVCGALLPSLRWLRSFLRWCGCPTGSGS